MSWQWLQALHSTVSGKHTCCDSSCALGTSACCSWEALEGSCLPGCLEAASCSSSLQQRPLQVKALQTAIQLHSVPLKLIKLMTDPDLAVASCQSDKAVVRAKPLHQRPSYWQHTPCFGWQALLVPQGLICAGSICFAGPTQEPMNVTQKDYDCKRCLTGPSVCSCQYMAMPCKISHKFWLAPTAKQNISDMMFP